MSVVKNLREALFNVAERHLPGDPLPCFCIDYEPGLHDEWCVDARDALAEADGMTRDLPRRTATSEH